VNIYAKKNGEKRGKFEVGTFKTLWKNIHPVTYKFLSIGPI